MHYLCLYTYIFDPEKIFLSNGHVVAQEGDRRAQRQALKTGLKFVDGLK